MRTANTPSENALSRSGVLLPCGTTDYHFRKLRIAARSRHSASSMRRRAALPRGSPLLLDGEILVVGAPLRRRSSRPRSQRSQVAGLWRTHKLCLRSLSAGNGVFPRPAHKSWWGQNRARRRNAPAPIGHSPLSRATRQPWATRCQRNHDSTSSMYAPSCFLARHRGLACPRQPQSPPSSRRWPTRSRRANLPGRNGPP